MTKKIKEMISVVRKYDEQIKKGSKIICKSYVAPIPDEVKDQLIKNFDKNIPLNSIVAVYDETLMHSGNAGIVFLDNGFYYKSGIWSKAVYFCYKDARGISEIENDNIKFRYGGEYYTIRTKLNSRAVLKLIDELVKLEWLYELSLGRKKEEIVPKEIWDKCHSIIHTMTIGYDMPERRSFLFSNADRFVSLMVEMTVALGKVFGWEISESTAKNYLEYAMPMLESTVNGRDVSEISQTFIQEVVEEGMNEVEISMFSNGWVAANYFYRIWKKSEESKKYWYEALKSRKIDEQMYRMMSRFDVDGEIEDGLHFELEKIIENSLLKKLP